MTIIDGGSDPATRRYEQARAKLDRMQAEQGPDGFTEHLLPHATDGWMLRALKFSVPIGLTSPIAGGAIAGVGALTHNSALTARGGEIAGFGGIVALLPGVPGVLGPFLQALPDPFHKDLPEVAAQREVVHELYQQTPEVVARR